MKRLILLLIVLVSVCYVEAKINLDSLWNIWNDETQPDTNRLNAMYDISSNYIYSQPDSAFYFSQIQYEFAKKQGQKEHMLTALYNQGGSFYVKNNYSEALDYYKNSISIAIELGKKKWIAKALNIMGVIYQIQGNTLKAQESYTRSLKINENIGDTIGIKGNFVNLSIFYQQRGNYVEAINYLMRTIKIDSTLNTTFINLGNIYKDLGDYDQSISYYEKSIRIAEEKNDKSAIAKGLSNIGTIYRMQGENRLALDYYNKSKKIFEDLGNKGNIAVININIANIHKDQHDYVKAINYLINSKKIFDEANDVKGIIHTLNDLGVVYYETGDYLKAIEYSTRALDMSQEKNIIDLTKAAAKSLWLINKKLGKHGKALEMYELYIVMRDSIRSERNQKEVIRQEYKYEYEKQAAADSVKNAEAQKVKDALLVAEQVKNKQQKQRSYFLYGGLLITLLFGGIIFNRFRTTNKQKIIIEKQKEEVDSAFGELEEKNSEILDSIHYAKRIQSAILPSETLVKEHLNESFILYKPKDIVAGDFYWLDKKDDKVFFAAADCTGHGVPGAMVSVLCNNGLNRSVRELGITDPADILNKTRELVIQEFEKSEEEVKDGMDIAMCSIEGDQLVYSGAHNPLWIIRNKELLETKADKQPVGKFRHQIPFTSHRVKLEKGDTIYVFTDGYVDQFGGPKNKKFKVRPFKELLLSIQEKSMAEQKKIIGERFEGWRGDQEQIDDVCVIGVRV